MKRALVAILVMALLLPTLLMGILLAVTTHEPTPSERALDEIPIELLGIYQAAARTCEGLNWTVLAAIHKVETDFGTEPVTSPKGAEGPMQFLPSTFAAYGIDGNGDGRADINDAVDAIFSAANLLCVNGADDPAQLASAIWTYNHSQAYVRDVLSLASAYGVVTLPAGAAFATAFDLLHNPRVILTPQARADLGAGIVDQRLVSLLVWISERHTITVTVFKTGHSKFVEDTNRISHHFYGRAADIFFVDGAPVSASSRRARQLVLEIASLDGDSRPDELGHPFQSIKFPGGFADADHLEHVHIGFAA